MTANQHPYPEHIVEALADAAFPHDLDSIDRANHALQALWDASRIDTVEQVDELPNDAVLIDRNRVVADDYVTHCIIDLPAHVLHWGNHDR